MALTHARILPVNLVGDCTKNYNFTPKGGRSMPASGSFGVRPNG